jgi:ribose transport system ATP-binding protein
MEKIHHPLLSVYDLSKTFTSTKALDHVNLDLYAGEVHALLGENGAGKSTLIKILTGVIAGEGGTIFFKGGNIGFDLSKLSISVIHQDLGLVDDLSVAENIALISGYKKNKSGLISWGKTESYAAELLGRMKCSIDPSVKVSSLSAAEKSMVAISRSLAVEADILILDEPTATLPKNDVEKLFNILISLKKKGMGILYVTHRLDEIFRIADRVTVLRNGQRITTKTVNETDPKSLVFDIVGKNMQEVYLHPDEKPGQQVILSVQGLATQFLQPVSFNLHEGEILALFGLRGAGHHELGRCIWGVSKRDEGSISIDGKRAQINMPADAIRNGIGFVSSKRHEEGIAASFSVRENIYINPAIGERGLFSFMSLSNERKECEQALEQFLIKPCDSEISVGALSGGNQQKVVLARWFCANSRIFIFEEPTIGIDVGAKAEIYNLMREGLKEGKSFILISSDYEEVSRICHRAIVFSRGRVVGEISRQELNDELLSGLASGAIKLEKKGNQYA